MVILSRNLLLLYFVFSDHGTTFRNSKITCRSEILFLFQFLGAVDRATPLNIEILIPGKYSLDLYYIDLSDLFVAFGFPRYADRIFLKSVQLLFLLTIKLTN